MSICFHCNGKIKKVARTVVFKSLPLGIIYIPNILVFECEKCHEQTLDDKQSDLLIQSVNNLENKVMRLLPIGEFISSTEVCAYLGITRQALNKDKRIKRGFLYFVKIGKQTLYFNESVDQFKKTKDGRIPIHRRPDVKLILQEIKSKKVSSIA